MKTQDILRTEVKTVEQMTPDGEILQSVSETNTVSTVKIPGSDEPDYFKIYTAPLGVMVGVDACYNHILLSILKRMTSAGAVGAFGEGGMEVNLSAYYKEQIARETNRTVSRVNQAIMQFKKAKYLLPRVKLDEKGDPIPGEYVRSVYIVNPHFFGKGKWTDIKKIRQTVTYDVDNKPFIEIETEFHYDTAESNPST